MVMKTHPFLLSAVGVLGLVLLSTSYAASASEYLHLTRHRDSDGNLLMAPTQHKPEPSVMQKMVMPAQPKTFERRSTDWGMSFQEVKDNEPVQPSWELASPVLPASEQRAGYHTQIEDIPAALTYTFYDNQLGQAKYVFEPEHEDTAEFVEDFHAVKNWINQSYGSPARVEEIWLDDLYQYDESLWGQAVLRGHLVMVAQWEKPGTDIVLVLDGGDDTVGLVAEFASTTYVRPVSYDMQGHEDTVEEAVVDDVKMEEVVPSDAMPEPAAEEDLEMSLEQEKADSPSEASLTYPADDEAIQELEMAPMPEPTVEEAVDSEVPLDTEKAGSPSEASLTDPADDEAIQELEMAPMPEPTVKETVDSEVSLDKEEPIAPHSGASLTDPVYEEELRELEEIEAMLIETSEHSFVEKDALNEQAPSVDSSEPTL